MMHDNTKEVRANEKAFEQGAPDDDELYIEQCPMCSGEMHALGAFGVRTAFRCRQCGWTAVR